jgi:2'-5' RNA ligase
VNYVVVPLDESHRRALIQLSTGAATASGLDDVHHCRRPHITLVAFEGVPRHDGYRALAHVAAAAVPFIVHASGFGFFCDDGPAGANLHLDVVRGRRLDTLQRAVCAALKRAGAEIAPWCEPERWTPHITLLDDGLAAAELGAVAAWLARRHHPSWNIPVDRFTVDLGSTARHRPELEFRLGLADPR